MSNKTIVILGSPASINAPILARLLGANVVVLHNSREADVNHSLLMASIASEINMPHEIHINRKLTHGESGLKARRNHYRAMLERRIQGRKPFMLRRKLG